MGEVVRFRRARLSGFIPDDLGFRACRECHNTEFCGKFNYCGFYGAASLFEFAKRGSPPDPDVA